MVSISSCSCIDLTCNLDFVCSVNSICIKNKDFFVFKMSFRNFSVNFSAFVETSYLNLNRFLFFMKKNINGWFGAFPNLISFEKEDRFNSKFE